MNIFERVAQKLRDRREAENFPELEITGPLPGIASCNLYPDCEGRLSFTGPIDTAHPERRIVVFSKGLAHRPIFCGFDANVNRLCWPALKEAGTPLEVDFNGPRYWDSHPEIIVTRLRLIFPHDHIEITGLHLQPDDPRCK